MNSVRKKCLALVLAAACLLPLAQPSLAAPARVERIQGKNRYETALQVSRAAFDQADYAVLASGEAFPDALVGGVLAGHLQAPLLTTSKDQLAGGLVEELERLGVKKVYLLGGENTLSKELEASLAPFSPVRLAGGNRYETAEKVRAELLKLQPEHEQVFYADGRNFPDALAAAPYVVAEKGGLLLSAGQPLKQGIALGGPKSVPGSLERIAGNNRYDTAVKIAQKTKDVQGVILVDGQNYADALAAAGLAAQKNYAILLTPAQGLAKEVASYLADKDWEEVLVVGGENSVSPKVIQEVKGEKSVDTKPSLDAASQERLQFIKDIQAGKKKPEDVIKRYAKDLGQAAYPGYPYRVLELHIGDFDGNGQPELLIMTATSRTGRYEYYNDRDHDALWYLSAQEAKFIDGLAFLTYFGQAQVQDNVVFSFVIGKGNPLMLTSKEDRLVELEVIHNDRWSIRRLEVVNQKFVAILRGDAEDNFKHSAEAEAVIDLDQQTYGFGKILKTENNY